MVECETGQVTPAMETAIRREVMRCAMMEWLVREASFEPRSIDDADAAAAAIESKVAAARAAIRLRDPSLALAPVAAAAAAALGHVINPAALPRVGRAVLGVLAELHDAELHVESGATVEEATRVLRDIHFGGRPPDRLSPPVRLSTAVAKAIERAPTPGMTDKVKTTGELMLAFFGADAFLDDVFTKERMIAFLAWCMRLPRLHGILCFRVEERPESGPKTESSERVVPLPETLLRLGFREWWFDSFHRPGPLLFPGATTSRRDGKASGNLAKGARPSGRISGSPTGTRTDTGEPARPPRRRPPASASIRAGGRRRYPSYTITGDTTST